MPKTPKPSRKCSVGSVTGWISCATSQFEAADLSYGHGTTCAFDEAVFLVLRTLGLPVDGLQENKRKRLTIEQSQKEKVAVGNAYNQAVDDFNKAHK